MKIRIKDRIIECDIQTRPSDPMWGGRSSKGITAAMTYDEALALFESGVIWSVIFPIVEEDGMTYDGEEDMSEYAISGPITDNRDGTVTVRMGKYRDEELMQETLMGVPASHAEAMCWRGIIEEAMQSIENDDVALAAIPLYPEWEKLVKAGALAALGMRFQYLGDLYKVISAHTFSAEWVPGEGTGALYARVDEAHSGTADDPIPYVGYMELEEGKHYAQGGVTYRCTRSSGAPMYHALADLVGLYVEVI